MKIAIHRNYEIFNHSTYWDKPWEEYCKKNNINYSIVNCFDKDILDKLKKFDCLLWHFSNYSLQEMLFARSILISAQNMGLRVFPDVKTSWHFDDKVAEMYLLKTVNAPIPAFWPLYTLKSCKDWLLKECQYPVIAKLRCGSGSNNVKLIKNKSEGTKYSIGMFKRGANTVPSILYKTKSNVKSSKNWETFVKRFKRIPDFMETMKRARKFPRERNYAFFQEYIPNDGYDLKIVVIGDKLSYIVRKIRKGDFRASGGGSLYFDKSLVTPDIIKSAFEISDKLKFQCMGYDYVVDNRNNLGKIVEISYGFSHTALIEAGGYWDREGIWHNEPLNAPEEIIKNIVNKKVQHEISL